MSNKDDKDRGQVSTAAAEVYEALFVPALFGPWTARMTASSGAARGQAALDVGCGTGVLARALWQAVKPDGEVTGLDVNEGMLAVARRCEPGIDWRMGSAEALPFDDDTFDVVTSQFALMFFDDRTAALAEMHRVLRAGGKLAVSVWGSLEEATGYAAMADLLTRLFGSDVARAIEAPFCLGAPETLRAALDTADLGGAGIETFVGTARFPSLEAWVNTDIRGWTLADSINDEQYSVLLDAARRELGRFAQPDGTVAFPVPAHVVTVRKSR